MKNTPRVYFVAVLRILVAEAFVRKQLLAAAVFSLLATPAFAAERNDVIIYPGSTPSDWLTGTQYRKLITEHGLLISSKTIAPSNTLGVNGFDAGFEMTVGIIHGQDEYWKKATKNGDGVPRVFAVPTLRVRKGFPFSLEGGMTVSYLPLTQQQVLGGQFRFALHEGFSLVPDVAIQLSYDEYIGNEQLDMNIKTGTASLGYTWAFGDIPGLNTGRVSAWVSYGKLSVDSQVNLTAIDFADTAERDAFLATIGTDSNGFLQLRFDKWVAGVQIASGRFVYLVNGEFVDSAIPTINMRWGASF